jgi:hypothetical protein
LKPSASRSFRESRRFEIVGDDLRAGRQRGLDPGLRRQALGPRLPGHEAGATSTLGFEVLVQEVMAAITTSPWPSIVSRPSTGTRVSEIVDAGFSNSLSAAPCSGEFGLANLAFVERDAVLRTLGAGERGHDLGEIEFEHIE